MYWKTDHLFLQISPRLAINEFNEDKTRHAIRIYIFLDTKTAMFLRQARFIFSQPCCTFMYYCWNFAIIEAIWFNYCFPVIITHYNLCIYNLSQLLDCTLSSFIRSTLNSHWIFSSDQPSNLRKRTNSLISWFHPVRLNKKNWAYLETISEFRARKRSREITGFVEEDWTINNYSRSLLFSVWANCFYSSPFFWPLLFYPIH